MAALRDEERGVDLRSVRKELGLSQAEMADLLGVSPRTVQSCEQGWRRPSCALERTALLLLIAHRQGSDFPNHVCWETRDCPPEWRRRCMPYLCRQGHLCWFLTGNVCGGRRMRTWDDKKAMCRECPFFAELLGERGFPVSGATKSR